MTYFKHLTAALALAVLTSGVSAADPPKAFEVGKGFSVEKGYSLTPETVPTAPAPTAKKPAKSDCPECDALKNQDPLWFAARIVVDNGDGTGSAGSGTPISCEDGKTVFVTNAHVVPHDAANKPIWVHVSGRKFRAKYRDGSQAFFYTMPDGTQGVRVEGDDLAFVEVDAELGHVELADADAPEGAQVWQFGYRGTGLNEGPTIKSGIVTRSNYVNPTLVCTLQTVSGDSGSGLFNTRGELVGVTWGGDSAEAKGLGVPIERVRGFAKRPLLSKLFPRLAARAEAKRAAKELAKLPPALEKPPEVPRQGKIDPKLAAPGKDAPKPKTPASPPKAANPVPQAPFGSGTPPAPPGEGWQWDANRKVWWKWSTPVQGVQGGVQGNCPDGKCQPAPQGPYYYPGNGGFRRR